MSAHRELTTAREHALYASELLNGVEARLKNLDSLSEDQRLQMAATGGFSRSNADIAFTVTCAQAHATVALALTSTEEEA